MEPNHTEFIFVDDGSVKKYGREITFRAKLEQAISSGFFGSKTTANSTTQFTSLQGTPSLRTDSSGRLQIFSVLEFSFALSLM